MLLKNTYLGQNIEIFGFIPFIYMVINGNNTKQFHMKAKEMQRSMEMY